MTNAAAPAKGSGATGTVVQVTGPVVDIEFPARALPSIYNAVRIVSTASPGVEAIDVVAEARAGGQVIERTALLAVSVEPNPNRGLWRIALIAIVGIAIVTALLFWLKSRREDRPAGGLGPL